MVLNFEYQGKLYNCIYADPAWSYENKNTGGSVSKGTGNNSGASSKYNTMTTKEIANIPIHKIADGNCCLFMWAVTPLLPEALYVMKEWGFTYKTSAYWYKTGRLGMGFWFRGDIEPLLIGIKGDVKAFHLQISNVIKTFDQKVVEADPREHSRKPDEVYSIIESIGFKNKIEMFARERRQGWDNWGNQVPSTTQMILG